MVFSFYVTGIRRCGAIREKIMSNVRSFDSIEVERSNHVELAQALA